MSFWKLKCFSFFLCLSCFHFNKLQISFKLQMLYAWLVTYLDHSVLRTKLTSLHLCFSLSSAFAQKLYDMIVFIFKKTTLLIVSRGFMRSLETLTEFTKWVVYFFVYFLGLFWNFLEPFEGDRRIKIWNWVKLGLTSFKNSLLWL